MKKVIFLFLCLFVVKLNVLGKTFVDYEILDVYYNSFVNGRYVSSNGAYMEYNGVPIYCLDFGVPISKTQGYNTYDLRDVGLYTPDQKKYMEIISFFGYKYGNHDDINYYLAAQELIWGSLSTDVYWTHTRLGYDKINLETYKREILDLYSDYLNENTHFNEEYNLEVGKSYFYPDLYPRLPKQDFIYYGENDVQQQPNGLMFKANVNGVDSVTLNRNFYRGGNSIIFIENGYQTILKSGDLSSKSRTLNFNINSAILNLNRVNKEESNDPTYKNKNLRLENAMYELYDSDYNFLNSFITDENGMAMLQNLSLGNYKIKEIIPSYGFEPNIECVEISVSSYFSLNFHNLYAKPIKKKLSITNVYKIDEVNYSASEIFFEVYRDGVLLKTIETDEFGKAFMELEYGKHVIRQINNKYDFEIEPEFELIINEFDNELNYIITRERTTTKETIEEDPKNLNEEELQEQEKEVPIDFEEANEIEYEETTQNLNIDELPQLFETKDILDLLCEKLLFLLLFY